MIETNDPLPWLLLIYRVPQEPTSRRTYVWRQLKQLGAVYLQQAAAILPNRPPIRAALEVLATRIQSFEGQASLLETRSPTPEWEQQVIRRFNEARDAEYAEVVENLERFDDEIRRETERQKFTFAELEDMESDWEKVQGWFERITVRDFLRPMGRSTTIGALEHSQKLQEAFSAADYQRVEAPDESQDGDSL